MEYFFFRNLMNVYKELCASWNSEWKYIYFSFIFNHTLTRLIWTFWKVRCQESQRSAPPRAAPPRPTSAPRDNIVTRDPQRKELPLNLRCFCLYISIASATRGLWNEVKGTFDWLQWHFGNKIMKLLIQRGIRWCVLIRKRRVRRTLF